MTCAHCGRQESHRFRHQNIAQPEYRLSVLLNASPMDRTGSRWLYPRGTRSNHTPYIDGLRVDWASTDHWKVLQATSAKQSAGNTPRYHVPVLPHPEDGRCEHNDWRLQWPPPHGNRHLDVFLHTRHRRSRAHLHHQWSLRLNHVNRYGPGDPVRSVP